MTSKELKKAVKGDPMASHWLKYALETLDNRPIDMARADLEVINTFISLKIQEGDK